jgi:hypothetical protein
MEYEFGLKYKVADDADMDELIEQLGEAGFDDALVGTGQPGRIALEFTREANSAEKAIINALLAVKEAIPDAKLLEVTSDLTRGAVLPPNATAAVIARAQAEAELEKIEAAYICEMNGETINHDRLLIEARNVLKSIVELLSV